MEEKEVKDMNEEVNTEAENAEEAVEETEEQTVETTEEEASEADESGEKKSFFKKDKKKDKKDEKIEELNDQLMRRMAEFDNFRKRTEKEKAQMFEMGAKSIIEKMLPVIDNFERGLGALADDEKDSAFAKGIEAIYKQLVSSLDEVGVKQIEAVGKEFDPNFHNAVMHAEDEELGENIVSEEFQKGYMYRDSVVRHSMVKVVN
ncbi:heat shock protein GrpE [Lachnospiraceae bacterium KM106-2]|nr:heat shock protein GrpE [Lachnospiraceae bacterium KM106-2]